MDTLKQSFPDGVDYRIVYDPTVFVRESIDAACDTNVVGPSKVSSAGGGRARVKANDFLLFNQQLAALLRAGIPILQSISMLRRRATSVRLRTVLEEVEEAIRGGAALSQAFAAQGAIFPRIYTASILAGERSGALDEVLSRYVTYMRRSVALRRKIRGALAYPMFLLLASLGMVIFLIAYVVPRMSELFAGFGGNLPLVTQIVLTISRWLTGNIIWLAPLVIVSAVVLGIWSRTPSGRLTIDRLKLKIPIAGKLLVQLSVAQASPSWPAVSLWSSHGRSPPNRSPIWNCGGAVRRSCR